jgi:hypothetical protein
MAVTKKNAVFWDITLCGSCKNRRFGTTYQLYHQDKESQRARNNVSSNFPVTVTADVVPSSLNLFALMMEAIRSSVTSVLTRATRHFFKENGILHSHSRGNLKSYITLTD